MYSAIVAASKGFGVRGVFEMASSKGGGTERGDYMRVGDAVWVASSTLRKQGAILPKGVGKSVLGRLERRGQVAHTWVVTFAVIPGEEFELKRQCYRCADKRRLKEKPLWSEAEEATLVQQRRRVDSKRGIWPKVAAAIDGRTPGACKFKWRSMDKSKYPEPTPAWKTRPLYVVLANEGVVDVRYGREDPATGEVVSTQLLHSGHFSDRRRGRVGFVTQHDERIHVCVSA